MAKVGPSSIEDRLNRIEGQVRGVTKLVQEGATPEVIMAQIKAVISSLESVKVELIKKEISEKLMKEIEGVVGLLK